MTKTKKAARTEQAEKVEPERVACPRCAGNKRILLFRAGDRSNGEPAGWKATLCPGCGGVGSVDEQAAGTILVTLEQENPA